MEYFYVPSKDSIYIYLSATSQFDKIRKREIGDRARRRGLDLFERGENLLFLNYRRVKIF